MPSYEFSCKEHGTFELDLSFTEYDQLERDEQKNALAPCSTGRCEETATRVLQLFGSISTSDDPSFGSGRNERRNREYAGFDDNAFGWTDKAENTKSWEYE